MVKAIKRRTGEESGEATKKKDPFSKRYGKIVILLAMALIVIGFTLNVPNMGSNGGEAPPTPKSTVDFGIGTVSSMEESEVLDTTEYHAVYGQMNDAGRLKERLNGDLFLLDNGVTQLILTDAGADKIEDEASGNFIIYEVASCGDFDCLVEGEVNGSMLFDIYELNETSSFLTTRKVGFPSALTGIEL